MEKGGALSDDSSSLAEDFPAGDGEEFIFTTSASNISDELNDDDYYDDDDDDNDDAGLTFEQQLAALNKRNEERLQAKLDQLETEMRSLRGTNIDVPVVDHMAFIRDSVPYSMTTPAVPSEWAHLVDCSTPLRFDRDEAAHSGQTSARSILKQAIVEYLLEKSASGCK